MATISRFEDLEIWQLARQQCQAVWQLIENAAFSKDVALEDQINRSSGSVMDNIAEGFDRFTKADFRHFLVIARGSNAEVRSQLYRAGDRRYIATAERLLLQKASINLAVKISNLVAYLYHSEYKSKLPSEKPGNFQEPGAIYHTRPLENIFDISEEFINIIQAE